MFDETRKYQKQDHFFWTGEEALSDACNSIPKGPGVFAIFRLAHGKVDLVQFGRSSIHQNNSLTANSLNEAITAHETSFKSRFKNEGIEALDIYWYITMDSNHQDLPGFVQALLIQNYFQIHGSLPPWNTTW